jgi:D-sedoheptulose 7-phosphate isomerase
MMNKIIEDHITMVKALQEFCRPDIVRFAEACTGALKAGRKVLFCGNGGSAADSQHLAAELVGRFQKERRGLPGIALTTDTSILTSIGNDYGFDRVFSRQVEALAAPGDVVVGLSTSGNSPNVVRALEAAKAIGAVTVGLTGQNGGKLAETSDICIKVPAEVTARIQEGHILIGHIVCQLIDEEVAGV